MLHSRQEPPGSRPLGDMSGGRRNGPKLKGNGRKDYPFGVWMNFHLAPLLSGNTAIGRVDAELCALYFAKIIGRSKLHGIGAALRQEDWAKTETDRDRFHDLPSLLRHAPRRPVRTHATRIP